MLKYVLTLYNLKYLNVLAKIELNIVCFNFTLYVLDKLPKIEG